MDITAKQPAFFIRQGKVVSETYMSEWFLGFAVSQKPVENLHNAIMETDVNANSLETGIKSKETIGMKIYTSKECAEKFIKELFN